MRTFFWLAIAAAFSLLLAVERVQERRLGIIVARMENEVSLKESRNQYLKYRINVLSSPQAVTKAAGEKLGMTLTPPANITVLK